MEETAGDIIKGAIDPETLYTRQNCIGKGGRVQHIQEAELTGV